MAISPAALPQMGPRYWWIVNLFLQKDPDVDWLDLQFPSHWNTFLTVSFFEPGCYKRWFRMKKELVKMWTNNTNSGTMQQGNAEENTKTDWNGCLNTKKRYIYMCIVFSCTSVLFSCISRSLFCDCKTVKCGERLPKVCDLFYLWRNVFLSGELWSPF